MRLAFWPGLGGGRTTLDEIAPVLRARGIDAAVLDPRYGARDDWSIPALAAELAATEADVYAGHSWGASVAATAAAARPPQALVLLDGGYIAYGEYVAFGAEPTLEGRIAGMRTEHAGYRWPSVDAYLAFAREHSTRWNDVIERQWLEGMREVDGEWLPPFDADELERIIRAMDPYDAAVTLASVPDDVGVLLVVANVEPEHEQAREELLERFERLVPRGEIRRVDAPHDVVGALGPELGDVIADWLAEGTRAAA